MATKKLAEAARNALPGPMPEKTPAEAAQKMPPDRGLEMMPVEAMQRMPLGRMSVKGRPAGTHRSALPARWKVKSMPPSPWGTGMRGSRNEAESACYLRVGPPSSETEMERVAGGLGGEALSEAEIVLRVRGGLGWAIPQCWAGDRVCIGPLWSLGRIWVPWKSWRSSMVSGCRATTEWSSLVAS